MRKRDYHWFLIRSCCKIAIYTVSYAESMRRVTKINRDEIINMDGWWCPFSKECPCHVYTSATATSALLYRNEIQKALAHVCVAWCPYSSQQLILACKTGAYSPICWEKGCALYMCTRPGQIRKAKAKPHCIGPKSVMKEAKSPVFRKRLVPSKNGSDMAIWYFIMYFFDT